MASILNNKNVKKKKIQNCQKKKEERSAWQKSHLFLKM